MREKKNVMLIAGVLVVVTIGILVVCYFVFFRNTEEDYTNKPIVDFLTVKEGTTDETVHITLLSDDPADNVYYSFTDPAAYQWFLDKIGDGKILRFQKEVNKVTVIYGSKDDKPKETETPAQQKTERPAWELSLGLLNISPLSADAGTYSVSLGKEENKRITSVKGTAEFDIDFEALFQEFAEKWIKPFDIDTVLAMAGQEDLTWRDLEPYGIYPTSSSRSLGNGWSLQVITYQTAKQGVDCRPMDYPEYIRLCKDGTDIAKDIREEGLKEFWERNQ